MTRGKDVDVQATIETNSPVGASPAKRFLRRFSTHRYGLACTSVLVALIAIACLWPFVRTVDPAATNFELSFARPLTDGALLGTDDLGRDLLSRVLSGLLASLEVGLFAVGISLILGTPLGLLASVGGLADSVVSRVTDFVLAFPFLILAVALSAYFGASLEVAALAIGVAQVPVIVRVVRAEALRIGALDFVSAAVVEGGTRTHVLARYVLPNAVPSVIVQGTVIFPMAILAESTLSFLGLGIQPPHPSLGGMLSDAQAYGAQAPWTVVEPGFLILLVCLAFNGFGDALRDALEVVKR